MGRVHTRYVVGHDEAGVGVAHERAGTRVHGCALEVRRESRLRTGAASSFAESPFCLAVRPFTLDRSSSFEGLSAG